MSEVKNVTITVPVGLNGWQQTGSVVINGMKVEFPMGVETQVPETAAALLEKLIEEAKGNAAEGSVGKYKQYVTDADGNAAWEDRLAYKTTAETEVVNLEETALTYAEDDNSFYLLSPWAAELMAGDVATVKYNGTDYECKAVDGKAIQPDAQAKMVAMGNLAAMGMEGVEGGNPNAPFALIAIHNGDLTEGLYGMLIPLDGATAATLSVTSKQTRTTIKTIDPEYLPNTGGSVVTAHATITDHTVDRITLEGCDMSFSDLCDAYLSGKTVQIMCSDGTQVLRGLVNASGNINGTFVLQMDVPRGVMVGGLFVVGIMEKDGVVTFEQIGRVLANE